MESGKVICRPCKHYHEHRSATDKLYTRECRHPGLTLYRFNPVDGSEMNGYADPMSVNRDLDCELFEA